MAGTLLHVTLARIAADAVDAADARAVALRHPHDFALGAVFFDLPYFASLTRTGIALALRRPLRYHPFGGELHRRSPAGLLLALLDEARSDAERALCFGAITHYAVDLVFHPEIERRLDLGGVADGERDGAHRRLEDQIDLHCHYHLLGTSGIGTDYARSALRLSPASDWSRFVRPALSRIHGASPTAEELEDWRAQLALYGLASAHQRAPWLTTLPQDDPDLLERSVALAEESIGLSAHFVGIAARYLDGETDRTGFLSVVPDRCALDGADALPPATV